MDNLEHYHEIPLNPERAEARRVWREKIAALIAHNAAQEVRDGTNG